MSGHRCSSAAASAASRVESLWAKNFSVAALGPVGFRGSAGHVRRHAKGLIPYKRAGLGCKEGVVVVTSPVKTVGRVEGRGRYASSTSFPWCCRDRRRRRGAPDAAPQDPSYNPWRRCHSFKDSSGYSRKWCSPAPSSGISHHGAAESSIMRTFSGGLGRGVSIAEAKGWTSSGQRGSKTHRKLPHPAQKLRLAGLVSTSSGPPRSYSLAL